jgi:hypothetical protein
MKHVLPGTVALAYHRGLPIIPLRYVHVTLISSPQFTSFYLTLLRLIYHFLNPFPKITWFTAESP